MPEFILDHGTPEAAKAFKALDTFTQGYIEAMFFTDASDPDDGDLQDATFAELAPETLAGIKEDCTDFLTSLPKDGHGRTWLDLANDYAPHGYDDTQAGHDFWLTRNGHGAGFWDRGLGEVGDKLSEHARPYGSVNLYRGDDGLLYLA